MTVEEVLTELESYGSEQTRNIFKNHGAPELMFGVKVGDMKKIQKKIKKDHELSLNLYNTGNADAMYFAGLIADEKLITKDDLQHWVENANWYMVSEYTVPWIAAESPFGFEVGMRWIDSKTEKIAASGWATLSSWISLQPDENLDIQVFRKLLTRVKNEIHGAPNRVRYTMNGFVISVGAYLQELNADALAIAESIGKVDVNLGATACKVPFAPDYIQKIMAKGYVGKKRKKARC